MRNWINLINEYADPDDRMQEPYYRGAAHRAPASLWDRPGFKEWFAGSRVAAPNGDPLIAFHGSFEQFSEFKLVSDKRRAYGFNRLGFWFDIDPRTPEYFAGYQADTLPHPNASAGGVMPCVLSIKKPFHLDSEFLYRADADELAELQKEYNVWSDAFYSSTRDDYGNRVDSKGRPLKLPNGERFDDRKYREMQKQYDKLTRNLIQAGTRGEHGGDRIDGFDILLKQLPNGAKSSDEEVDEFKRQLIAEGHDGIYLGDTAADFASRKFSGTDWWIAFHPNQIKSIFAQSFSDSSDIMR